jgi:hypothetical protein
MLAHCERRKRAPDRSLSIVLVPRRHVELVRRVLCLSESSSLFLSEMHKFELFT